MITFDITFIPGPGAIGAFLEYRPVHPSGPLGLQQYIWVTNINTPNSDVMGYFPITNNPMFLDDVPGISPAFQENAVYEFRIRQVCADGTELYSPIDGDYFIPACDRFLTDIVVVPIQQGPFGIEVTIGYRPQSSVSNYIIELLDAGNVVGTRNVSYIEMDTTGNNPFQYIFTNDNLTAPNVLNANGNYTVRVSFILQTNTGPLTISNCNTVAVKSPGCSSYDIDTGDGWGIRWFDCFGVLHECYSPAPYNFNGAVPLRLCALGTPYTWYCDNTLNPPAEVPGFTLDPSGAFVTRGARVTQVGFDQCLPGYNDYSNGIILHPNGAPVVCDPNNACSGGGNNIIIITRCMPDSNLDVTTYRNGDPIPYVDDPAIWNTLTTGAWCWPQFNPANAAFGKLYNYYAVEDPRNIAPIGYHVPTYSEWFSFIYDLTFVAGFTPNNLRIVDSTYWNNNAGATDTFGFSAKGSGNTDAAGLLSFKASAGFWTILDPLANPSYYFINTLPVQNYGWRNNIGDPSAFKSIGCGVRLFCGD